MSSARRGIVALLLAAVAALGLIERSALHAHPLDELDLTAHELSLIAPGPACGGGAHFDRATPGDHPVCNECTLAASSLAAGPPAPARLGRDTVRVEGDRSAARRAAELERGASGARGPPRA